MVYPLCMRRELPLASPPLRDGLLGGLAANLRTRPCLPHGKSVLVDCVAYEEAMIRFQTRFRAFARVQ